MYMAIRVFEYIMFFVTFDDLAPSNKIKYLDNVTYRTTTQG